MSIEEELALRMMKQRLPLRIELTRMIEEKREMRQQIYNLTLRMNEVSHKIKELDGQIDRHLMEVDTNGK